MPLRNSPTGDATATLGTGVTATVNNAATLELAGSVSALSSGTNLANVTNSSNAAAGILISGANQQVGGVDGSGNLRVNAGASFTANHIIQAALGIGGTADSPASVTIAASDASGNPLESARGGPQDQPSGFELDSADLSSGGSTALDVSAAGNLAPIETRSPVPEPSTLLLALVAILGVAGTRHFWRPFRTRKVFLRASPRTASGEGDSPLLFRRLHKR